jgi:hypothetical protein
VIAGSRLNSEREGPGGRGASSQDQGYQVAADLRGYAGAHGEILPYGSGKGRNTQPWGPAGIPVLGGY